MAGEHGLSQVKGFDERFYGQYAILIEDFISNNFAHVELNPDFLAGREDRLVFSDHWLYMSNKTKKYHHYEQLYLQDKCHKEDFPFMLSMIFFYGLCPWDKINKPLGIAIGELHKGSLVYLHQKLAILAKKYQTVPDGSLNIL